ncbi:MAG TPA: GFA family protein [Steroidobacteraceae bacterium]|nr:GFA family protein [Steroidobacteraceae bacterium]
MKVEGQCHCGQITFEAEIDPNTVGICHCTDCQTLTGSAYRVTAHAPAAQFTLRSGTPKVYIKTAESGTKRAHGFCATCGTPLYATDVHEPKSYGIRVGTLKQRAELPPRRQIWYRSALHWATDLRELPQIERQQN